jgi:hypothetical protein
VDEGRERASAELPFIEREGKARGRQGREMGGSAINTIDGVGRSEEEVGERRGHEGERNGNEWRF